jgi:hypothetical protein
VTILFRQATSDAFQQQFNRRDTAAKDDFFIRKLFVRGEARQYFSANAVAHYQRSPCNLDSCLRSKDERVVANRWNSKVCFSRNVSPDHTFSAKQTNESPQGNRNER